MLKYVRRVRGRSGSALILFTLMMPTVIIPMVGLAIDASMLFIVKARLSSAVDGGAIAAARSLSAGMSLDAQKVSAATAAEEFVHANFPNGYWGAQQVTFPDPVKVEEGTGTSLRRRIVTINARVDVPLLFMRIFGKQTAEVRVSGQAARRDVRMVLVLDRSSSMSGVIGDLRNAAGEFVNRFAEGRDQVGLVVFGGSAIVAFPPRDPTNPAGGTGPASNFKSATPSIPSLIASTNAGSNTGMAEGLWLAYKELKKNQLDGALNLIVLFTDGLPNGLTAWYNDTDATKNLIAAGSGCKYPAAAVDPITKAVIPSTQMIGFLSQQSKFATTGTVSGIFQLMNQSQDATHPNITSWLSKPQELVIPNPASQNCVYYPDSNKANVPTAVKALPAVDYYGNRTDGTAYQQSTLYKSKGVALNLSKVNSPYQIGLASWNAVDDVARRIRADATISPVIYTIGYDGGDEKPDPILMKRISNVDDPDNKSYDAGKPAGLYVMAPTPAQLAAAFGKVASEILRLTN